MDSARKVVKNSFFVLTARVIDALLNLLILTSIARYLGINRFGIYSLVLAIVWVLSPMLFLGLNQIVAREVATQKDRVAEILGDALILNILMVIPVIVCAVPFVYVFDLDSIARSALFITIGAFMLEAFIRNFFGVIIAFEKTEYLLFITLANVSLKLLLTLGAVYLDLGFLSLFIAMTGGELVSLFVGLRLFKKRFTLPEMHIRWKNLSLLFQSSLPLMFSLFLTNGFLYLGVFLLKIMATDADVGLFQAPHKILTRMQLLPMAFFIALLPVFSRLSLSADSLDKFRLLYAKTLKMTLIFSIPITIIGIAFSEKIILLLFGSEFYRAHMALSVLLSAFPFLCLTSLYRYLLIALKKQTLVLVSDIICLISAFLADIILIPRMSFIGACLGTLLGLFIQTGTNYFFLARHCRDIPLKETLVMPVLSGIVLFFFVLGSRDNILLLPFGVMLYAGTLFISRAVSKEDVEYLKRIIHAKKGM